MPSWKLVSAWAICATLAVDARPASVPASISPKMSNREAAAVLFSESANFDTSKVLSSRGSVDNEPRWVALGANFKLPGRPNTIPVTNNTVPSPNNIKSVASRLMKRVQQVVDVSVHKLVSRSEQELALEEAIESAKDIVKRATSAAVPSSDTCEATPSATCSLTIDCAGETIPSNSHHYCGAKRCTWSEQSCAVISIQNADTSHVFRMQHRVLALERRLRQHHSQAHLEQMSSDQGLCRQAAACERTCLLLADVEELLVP